MRSALRAFCMPVAYHIGARDRQWGRARDALGPPATDQGVYTPPVSVMGTRLPPLPAAKLPKRTQPGSEGWIGGSRPGKRRGTMRACMGDTPLIPVRRGPWRLATIILLAGLAIMVALTFQSYGTTWDEEYHSVYGNAVLGWYRTFFQDRTALQYGDLYLYGGLFDALAQLATRVLPFGEYESRHLVGAALGLVGIAATWRLAALLAGERGGFIAAVILALTPPYWGHAFANPKDAPFAALSTLAIVAALSSARAVPRIPWRSAVEAGAAAGCAMGVRVVGILLLGWLALAWMGHLLARRPPEGWGRALAQLSLRYAAAVAVAWAIMLVGWPWAQLSPWLRPFQALRQLGHFQMVYDVLFDGRTWPSSALPPTYVPTWFALTLPETYFVGAMAGMAVVGLALAGRRGALAK